MDLTLVGNIFYLVGGLGLFLYGIHIMSEGLQKSTGSKLSYYLGKATDNRLMGVLVGALITAIIHSSSAVTVMVVGLVNAGMMNLMQATGVIMGANIGTTVTSWFVSLVQIDLGDTMEIFSPSFFAPPAPWSRRLHAPFPEQEGQPSRRGPYRYRYALRGPQHDVWA